MLKKIIFVVIFLYSCNFIHAQPVDTSAEELTISVKDLKIHGTLLPAFTKEKIVIIIAGSGPTDRDGNSPLGIKCNTYRILASDLQQSGMASFRYDKRGIAASSYKQMDESKLSFEDYVDDVQKIFYYLRDTLGYKDFYIAGHSEGSLVGMIAAQRIPVKGFISMAGAGRPINNILTEQITANNPVIGKQTDSLFNVLKEKGKIDTVPPYLLNVFRPSVQPYMLSWMKYDPTIEIKKLQVPVLILQGTCDVQVKTTDANFLHEANKQATYLIIDGMTHTLKDARTGCDDKDMKTYKDPSLPLNNKLVTEIIKFVKDN
ncbi:MAG: alpha/beta fold hydrolase [Chitinophagaceae bacterium]|nr:alpha/beta fold hydrolase [Chitinophagaceae bacterium]